MAETCWQLYVIRCDGRLLYTGITTDPRQRFEAHCTGKGARFTRGRRKLELVYQASIGSHSLALRAEIRFKRLSPARKRHLIAAQIAGAELLAQLGLSSDAS